MTAPNWQDCTVVRVKDDILYGRYPGHELWEQVGYCGDGGERLTDEWNGPITPVLDAVGRPVVTTVGDLTARHVGQTVRVGSVTGTLDEFTFWCGQVEAFIIRHDGRAVTDTTWSLDTPCEVLS